MIGSVASGANMFARAVGGSDPARSGLVGGSQGGAKSSDASVSISPEAAALYEKAQGSDSASSLTPAATQEGGSTSLEDALAAFKKEAAMTPFERARRDVMKSMNVSEDDLKAMSPEQRKTVEQSITDAVARRLQLGNVDSTHNRGQETRSSFSLSA